MAHITYARDRLGGRLEIIEFDATTYENYVDSADVTEHPVEAGQNVSDYVKPKLARLTLTGMVTNTPLNSKQGPLTFEPWAPSSPRLTFQAAQRLMRQGASISGGFAAPLQPPGFKVPPSPIRITPAVYDNVAVSYGVSAESFTKLNRVRSVYQRLVKLQAEATVVSVSTSLQEYFDMLIHNISVPRSEAEDSIDVTIEFVKYISVSAEEVSVRRPPPRKKQPETDRPKPTEPPVTSTLITPTNGFNLTPTQASVLSGFDLLSR